MGTGIDSLLGGQFDRMNYERQRYLNQLNGVDPTRMFADGYSAALRDRRAVDLDLSKPNKKLLLTLPL